MKIRKNSRYGRQISEGIIKFMGYFTGFLLIIDFWLRFAFYLDYNVIHLYSVKDFELRISISTEKLKPKCLVFKLKSISDSSFAFDE